MENKSLLLLTDFSYQAKGRDYSREDVELCVFFRKYFKVLTAHNSVNLFADVILIRNTGPLATHHEELMALKERGDSPLFVPRFAGCKN